MAEYISRKSFIERVKDIPFWGSVAVLIAEQLPAADVRPVVRGKWERTSKSLYACSECGNCVVDERIAGMFYCPSCGADMRPEPPKEET